MAHVFSRSILQEFHRQIGLFRELVETLDEAQIWGVPENWTNSVGAMARHLVGNVHHFVGKDLLATAYVREREAEFRALPCDKAVLLRGLEDSQRLIEAADGVVSEADWGSPRTTADGRSFASLAQLMAFMASHASYHHGQASVLARILNRG